MKVQGAASSLVIKFYVENEDFFSENKCNIEEL